MSILSGFKIVNLSIIFLCVFLLNSICIFIDNCIDGNFDIESFIFVAFSSILISLFVALRHDLKI